MTPIFYVTRDPERATGIENAFEDYHIVCPYESELTKRLREQDVSLYIMELECFHEDSWTEALKAGTYGLLGHPCVIQQVAEHPSGSSPKILVLKTSPLLESWCRRQGWELWAPRADIAQKYENKLSQYEALRGVVNFPPTEILTLRELVLREREMPFVMQFASGHSGEGTFVVKSKEGLGAFAERFSKREVRVAPYLKGDAFTLNALVLRSGKVVTGSLSLQLTGDRKATNNPATTVGNDFGAPRQNLTREKAGEIGETAARVGEAMAKEGYVGMFGVDVIVQDEDVFFIEVNCHQPASISFEAVLHRRAGVAPLFELFVRDMLREEVRGPFPELFLPFAAKQTIWRNKESRPLKRGEYEVPEGALASRMRTIQPNEELYRVQEYDS